MKVINEGGWRGANGIKPRHMENAVALPAPAVHRGCGGKQQTINKNKQGPSCILYNVYTENSRNTNSGLEYSCAVISFNLYCIG